MVRTKNADCRQWYDRAEVLARLERDNKCWELCLVFHLHCDLTGCSVYVCALQDSAGVAIACCFVTAALRQQLPISSPPRSFSSARIVH